MSLKRSVALALAFVALVASSPLLLGAADAGPTEMPSAAADVEAPALPEPSSPSAAAAPTRMDALRAAASDQSLAGRLIGVLGVLTTLGLALALSSHRRQVRWPLVAMGTGLQFVFALLILKTAVGEAIFENATAAVNKLLSFSVDGSRFVFGNLVDPTVPVVGGEGLSALTLAHIAFGILPTILFFSALTSLLYYLGVLQWVVKGMAALMRRTMGTSGAESLSASANIFVGQTEAPLLVRPYVARMTKSELMAVMTGGFATVAGGVMAAYVGMLQSTFPDIAGHLLAASVMSAPASLVIAKIMVPETEVPETSAGAPVSAAEADGDDDTANVVDAVTKGTSDGLKLALNVGAMLITFIALVALVNGIIGWGGAVFGREGLTLQGMFGVLLAPFAWLLGVPWDDAAEVGALMGTKTVINEFVAFKDLAAHLAAGELHPKSVVIATYALCGFSNFGSIGIQIGGLAAIAPSRRADLARLGLRAMIAGSLACFQTAALAGILV